MTHPLLSRSHWVGSDSGIEVLMLEWPQVVNFREEAYLPSYVLLLPRGFMDSFHRSAIQSAQDVPMEKKIELSGRFNTSQFWVGALIRSDAQNSLSQASIVHEPWTSRCSSWIWKRQRNQRSNCQHPSDHQKARELQKNIYFYFIKCTKAFDCVNHNKLWYNLQEMGIPDHLTCLLRNLYGGQEATVRNGHGTTNWFQIGKGVCQSCILSPCLFNLYAEYIMRNAGLGEAQL